MVGKNLHRRFGVRIVRWLELQVGHPQLGEEGVEHANQVPKRQVVVADHAFNLVELRQVSGVQCLVTEDTVNRKVLLWLEGLILACLA